MKKTLISIKALMLFFYLASCQPSGTNPEKAAMPEKTSELTANTAKGELFIIGGGKRPPSLIKGLLQTAELQPSDYIIVLPMSSEVPDTSFMYAEEQFVELDFKNVRNFYFPKGSDLAPAQYDSLKKAKLIYISGGDQNRFMDIISGTQLKAAINEAYQNGATIAGTSAGAAVQSEKMITGNELKYPGYEEPFRHIESNNIEIAQGLGLIKSAIIDQHFIIRSRHNRLISAIIEHPDLLGIGIDESTAIIVKGNHATVTGTAQVIVFSNPKKSKNEQNGLLGGQQLQIDIFLPGEKFAL